MQKKMKKPPSLNLPDLFEKKCAQCGKIFYPAYAHVFKRDGLWFCRCSCENAFLRAKEEKRKKDSRNRTYPVTLTDVKSGAVLNFESATEAAEKLDLCLTEIRKCCRGERQVYRGYFCEYRKEIVAL